MRISDWSSDVCSSDLSDAGARGGGAGGRASRRRQSRNGHLGNRSRQPGISIGLGFAQAGIPGLTHAVLVVRRQRDRGQDGDDPHQYNQIDQGKALLIVFHGSSTRSDLNYTSLVSPTTPPLTQVSTNRPLR